LRLGTAAHQGGQLLELVRVEQLALAERDEQAEHGRDGHGDPPDGKWPPTRATGSSDDNAPRARSSTGAAETQPPVAHGFRTARRLLRRPRGTPWTPYAPAGSRPEKSFPGRAHFPPGACRHWPARSPTRRPGPSRARGPAAGRRRRARTGAPAGR